MDLTTILGASGALTLVVLGVLTGELESIFLNWHGILIVFGGTVIAMLVNTPLPYVRETAAAMLSLLRPDPFDEPAKLVPVLVRLAEQVQVRGLGALREADAKLASGFVAEAATTALEYNNPDFVRRVLESEVNNKVDRQNEIINVIRTAGVLSPMFGLIGTLVGIVKVLKVITEPDKVGPAMAVAITTAFYGIILANLICVPVAGKLRMRLWEEIKVRAMVIEAIVSMMQGTVPLVLERRLQAFK